MLSKLLSYFAKKFTRQPEPVLCELEKLLRDMLCEKIFIFTATIIELQRGDKTAQDLDKEMLSLSHSIDRYVRAVSMRERSAAGESISPIELVELKS